jgi:hypothetical protein
MAKRVTLKRRNSDGSYALPDDDGVERHRQGRRRRDHGGDGWEVFEAK